MPYLFINSRIRYYLLVNLASLLLLIWPSAQAQQIQNYPVQTTAYFAAPFSQRLSDYFTSDKRLLVDLLLKDLTKSTVEVYLKWSIEGVGIRVQSRDTYLPPSFITLQRGVVNRLRGSDLQTNYFNPAAIETQGIDPRSVYAIELPEGFYTLKVQAFEAATGQVVSNVSETYMVLAYPQPPILNLPMVGTEVPVTSLQKVPISWAPRHFASPTTQAVYHLQVCQVPDDFEPTELVMLTCTEPRLDKTVPTTSYAGDITQWIKPLEVGKRYAVQVTVTDLSGELTNFVNQGRSQVSWFRYGKECTPPAFTIQSLGTDRVQLSWGRTEGAQGYVVEYKLTTAAGWQSVLVSGTSQVIGSLNPTADYLFRMRTDCGGSAPSAPSEIQSWNIRDEAPDVAPELPLELTNPIAIRVQTGVDGQTQIPTSLSALYSNFPRAGLPQAGLPRTIQSGAASNGRTDVSSGTTTNGSSNTTTTTPQGTVNDPGSTTGSVATSAQPGSVPNPSATSTGSTPAATDLPLLTLPYCAVQASSFAGCELPHPSVGLPTGERELTSLSVGDVLGIYDYAVFVTKVGGGSPLSGEGMARLPFLNGTMVLVEFSGVSAKAGEPGTNGGCVYAVPESGYFRIKRATQAEVLTAQRGLIASLVSKTATDSTKAQPVMAVPFVGTLGEALAKFDSVVVSLTQSTSQPLSVATRQALVQYTAAIAQGSASLKSSFDAVYGSSRDPLAVSIRDSLAVLMSQVNTTLSTLQNGSTVTDLSVLRARYEALFAQLDKLTNPATTTPALPTISLARLGNLTDNSTKLSWQGDPSFTTYVVHYKLEGGGELQQTVTSPSVQLLNLKAGTHYTYSIDAYQGTTLVSSFGGAPFTTLTKSIPPPQNLAYTVLADNSVRITWDKNKAHQSYKLVYTDQDGNERTVYPTTNQDTLVGLGLNREYPFSLVAYGSENLVSTPATSSLRVGTICSAAITASAERVIEGAEVTLTVSSCRDASGKDGYVTWQGKGLSQTSGTKQVVNPSETTIYTSHCQLQGANSNGSESITCTDSKTIIVDKACTGVVVRVSPATIDIGQPVALQSTGCADDVQWTNDYYGNGVMLGTQPSIVVYPQSPQNYILSCTDQTGTSCVLNAGAVDINCNFQLSVQYEQPYYNFTWIKDNSDPLNDGEFIQVLKTIGIGIGDAVLAIWNLGGWVGNGFSQLKKEAGIQAVGCPGVVSWEYDHATKVESFSNDTFLYLKSLSSKTAVRAKCVIGSKICEQAVYPSPPPKKCKDFRITVKNESTKEGTKLNLSVNSDSDVQWEDGSLGKARTVDLPTKAKVFTANSDGCQASVGFDPPIPDHNAQFAVPCDGGFMVPAVINVVIPANKPQAITTLAASGCTNGVDYYTITWKDQTGKTLSADIAGRTNVTFYSADAGKQFRFTATCARTNEVKTTLVTVTQAKPATTPSKPTTPTTYPVVPNLTDPCNFILSTKYSDSYDVFVRAENVEIKVQTTGNIQAFVERASDGLVPSAPSISNNIITISHQAVDGTFWVKVINIVDGRSCEGYIFITVNNNRGVYLFDNTPKQPAYTPKPVQSPKS